MLIDTETVRNKVNKGSFLTPGVIAVMVFPGTGESQFVTNFERKNIKNQRESFRPKNSKKGNQETEKNSKQWPRT